MDIFAALPGFSAPASVKEHPIKGEEQRSFPRRRGSVSSISAVECAREKHERCFGNAAPPRDDAGAFSVASKISAGAAQ